VLDKNICRFRIVEVNQIVIVYVIPQYAFMAWCSVKAQGQIYLYLTFQYIYIHIYMTVAN